MIETKVIFNVSIRISNPSKMYLVIIFSYKYASKQHMVATGLFSHEDEKAQ